MSDSNQPIMNEVILSSIINTWHEVRQNELSIQSPPGVKLKPSASEGSLIQPVTKVHDDGNLPHTASEPPGSISRSSNNSIVARSCESHHPKQVHEMVCDASVGTKGTIEMEDKVPTESPPTRSNVSYPAPQAKIIHASSIINQIPTVHKSMENLSTASSSTPCCTDQRQQPVQIDLSSPNASSSSGRFRNPPAQSRRSDDTGTRPMLSTHSMINRRPVCDLTSSSSCSTSSSLHSHQPVSIVKKTKLGLPFFRNRNSGPVPPKSVQIKELKRMIRTGNPSYEQIHNWGHSFEMLLNDKYGLALFKEFLTTEFSDENIEFWIACQEYRHITNSKKLAIQAQRIFDEYVAVQANREVNLDSKTRLQTEQEIVNPTRSSLDNAQKRIQALMEKDSYRRFLRSDTYLMLYEEARQTAKAVAASALAASLHDASHELEGSVLRMVQATSLGHTQPSGISLATLLGSGGGSGQPSSTSTGFGLPGVAAAAASAQVGMNCIQDLQLLGLSTSRHMRSQLASSSGKSCPQVSPRRSNKTNVDESKANLAVPIEPSYSSSNSANSDSEPPSSHETRDVSESADRGEIQGHRDASSTT